MKFALVLLLALQITMTAATSAFAGPGGTTTPFPFGSAPEDFVGTWTNPNYHASVVIQKVQSPDGKEVRLYMVMSQGESVSQGYLYFTGKTFCGVLFNSSGKNLPICLKGRFGLLSVETQNVRLYFTHDKRLSRHQE